MADSNKLVTMIALVIAGLLVAAWGAIYIWLHRNDQLVVADLQRRGLITQVEVARFTNPTWVWILAIIQIIIGLALIIWGVFQYFVRVDDVVVLAKDRLIDPLTSRLGGLTTRTLPNATVVAPGATVVGGSRRNYA